MPSAKKKRQQRQQTRLGSLNPSTMNTCFVAPSPNATTDAAATAAPQFQFPFQPAARVMGEPVVMLSADDVVQARKTEVAELPLMAESLRPLG